MNRNWLGKWFGIVGLVAAAAVLFSLSSCARDQELLSISITPSTETFGAANIPVSDDQGLNVQLRALGSYVHPAVTKDITDQVTWASNTPDLATVDASGVVTATGLACGGSLISATVQTNKSAGGRSSSGAIVTGYMTTNVVCFTGTGVPLTVGFDSSTGSGTVVSSPLGLSCASTASTCSGNFTSGATVNLVAAANGTFGGWAGCDSVDGTGLICTVKDLTSARTVTATFN
ncbi:MAG: Ig-like domain-containing protein [Candidatus Sulfotelmatobacter sp.]